MTGHTGFKGAWLSLVLVRLGADVTGYALAPPTEPALWPILGLEREVRSVEGDVRDGAALRAALAEARPEVVLHLAAQPLVRASYRDPVETWTTQVLGTLNLLEALRSTPTARALVVVTTDKVYVEADGAHAEGAPLGGRDPYSASKASVELLTRSHARSFFTPGHLAVATARAGNVLGAGDWAAERLLPDAVRAWTSGRELVLRHPGARRPWQHVLDALRGYLLLAEALLERPQGAPEAVNFGPEGAPTVGEVVEQLAAAWGPGARWSTSAEPGPHESAALRLDSTLAARELGWRARVGLREALEWTASWHQQQARGAPAERLREVLEGRVDAVLRRSR